MTTEHLPLTVEAWSDDGRRIEEVLARAGNHDVARAAFEAAKQIRPRAYLMLRDRARVVAERPPNPAAPGGGGRE